MNKAGYIPVKNPKTTVTGSIKKVNILKDVVSNWIELLKDVLKKGRINSIRITEESNAIILKITDSDTICKINCDLFAPEVFLTIISLVLLVKLA